MRRITNYPIHIALGKEERVYVLCRNEGAATIRRYSLNEDDGGIIGSYGKEDGQFTWPVAMVADADENLYVTDEYLNQVTIFDKEGEFVGKWGEFGSGEGQLDHPAGIAFDADGNVYVVDSLNHRVQKFTKDGKYLLGWGSHGDGEGEFDMPWGITVDELGDVYVADWRNDRVQKFGPEGEFKFLFGGTGSEDGRFNRPVDVAVDKHGDIYVADWGNDRVQLFNEDAIYVQKFLGDASLSKVGREYMLTNASVNRIRDMSVLEPQKYLRRPKCVVVNDEGQMFVADNLSYRVQVYQKDVIELTSSEFGPPMRSVTLNQE